MAIVKLSKMQLIGLKTELPAIINYLSKQGAIEVRRNTELEQAFAEQQVLAEENAKASDNSDFEQNFISEINHLANPQAYRASTFKLAKVDFSAISLECQRRIDFLDKQINLSAIVKPQKSSMFKQKDVVSLDDYIGMTEKQVPLLQSATDFAQLSLQIDQLQVQLNKQIGLVEQLRAYQNVQISPLKRERRFNYFLGTLRNKDQFVEFSQVVADSPYTLAVQSVDGVAEEVLILLACLQSEQPDVERLLNNFSLKALPTLVTLVPENGVDLSETYKKAQAETIEMQSKLKDLTAKRLELTQYTPEWRILSDFYRIQAERLTAICQLSTADKIFVLEAFIPSNLLQDLYHELETNYCTVCQEVEIGEDENVPVLLSNNRKIRPYENVIEEFSMPDYRTDIDPTWILAPGYAFFFGAMLSDIGYGLIFLCTALYLIFTNKVHGNARRFMWIFAGGGFFAILWGLAFGSFFGDLPTALTHGAFTLKPLFADPFKDPMLIMATSVGLGVAHIAIGMLLNIYKLCKNGDPRTAFTEIAPWFFIFGGIGCVATGLSWGKWLCYVAIFVIVFLSKKNSKNPVVQLVSGILKLYDITGFVGDILSYTRITALILSTSVIAMVVNMFAKMIGFGFPNFIITILILLLGHTMNIMLSGLSAYVHTTRLHYVEFFGRFYDGGGDLFKPLSIHTKYTEEKIKQPSLVERLRRA